MWKSKKNCRRKTKMRRKRRRKWTASKRKEKRKLNEVKAWEGIDKIQGGRRETLGKRLSRGNLYGTKEIGGNYVPGKE